MHPKHKRYSLSGVGEFFVPLLISDEEFNQYLETIKKEDDRGAVIISAALIDDLLRIMIERRCVKTFNTDKLFEMSGPFATTYAKSIFLRASGAIPERIYSDLTIMRRLRNKCAHTWKTFSIDSEIAHNYTSKLSSYANTLDTLNKIAAPDLPSVRSVFDFSVWMLLLSIATVGEDKLTASEEVERRENGA
jgi:hypothetical protein